MDPWGVKGIAGRFFRLKGSTPEGAGAVVLSTGNGLGPVKGGSTVLPCTTFITDGRAVFPRDPVPPLAGMIRRR
jgi:hypothetical protein